MTPAATTPAARKVCAITSFAAIMKSSIRRDDVLARRPSTERTLPSSTIA